MRSDAATLEVTQPAVDDPRIGMLLGDRYRIVAKLGQGGMGAVYEAEHVHIRKRVALKCLHAHYAAHEHIVARFRREALAATAIGNEHIIEVTDMGTFPDGAVYLVLEYLEGRDFSAVIEDDGPVPLSRVVHVASQVCDALGAAHAKGIVHRDLKPENVFLIKRGGDPDFVKVLDFGISKMLDAAQPEGVPSSNTRTGVALGTPYYMAPEQARGRKEVDHRADLYSLGVMLFNALTGQYPFDDESFPMLIVKICSSPPPPLGDYRQDVPPEFVRIVEKLLAKRPEDRYASCAAVKDALEPFRNYEAKPVLAQGPRTASLSAVGLDALDAPRVSIPVTIDAAAEGLVPRSAAPLPAQSAGGGETAPPNAAPPAPQPLRAAEASVTPGSGRLPAPSVASLDTPAPRTGPAPNARASRRRAPLVAAVVALVAGGAGVTIWAMERGGDATHDARSVLATTPVPAAVVPTTPATVSPPVVQQREQTPTAPPTPAHVEPEAVQVAISTTPDDAVVLLDGQPLANPFEGFLPVSSAPRRLEARKPGYRTRVQDLVLTVRQIIRIRLHAGNGVEDVRHVRAPDTGSAAATPGVDGAGAPTTSTTGAGTPTHDEARVPVAPPPTPAIGADDLPPPQALKHLGRGH